MLGHTDTKSTVATCGLRRAACEHAARVHAHVFGGAALGAPRAPRRRRGVAQRHDLEHVARRWPVDARARQAKVDEARALLRREPRRAEAAEPAHRLVGGARALSRLGTKVVFVEVEQARGSHARQVPRKHGAAHPRLVIARHEPVPASPCALSAHSALLTASGTRSSTSQRVSHVYAGPLTAVRLGFIHTKVYFGHQTKTNKNSYKLARASRARTARASDAGAGAGDGAAQGRRRPVHADDGAAVPPTMVDVRVDDLERAFEAARTAGAAALRNSLCRPRRDRRVLAASSRRSC